MPASHLKQRIRQARYRLDYVAVVKEVFGLDPDRWQQDILYAPGDDHILACSRQAGKSEVAGGLVAATAINKRSSLSLVISTGREAAGEFLGKVIIKIQAAAAQNITKITQQNAHSITLENKSRIICLPSTEAATRGWTVNGVLVLDECSRIPDPVIDACLPVVSVGGGATLMLSTPNGKSNRFAQVFHDDTSRYIKTLVPATMCPRLSPEFLEQQKTILGPTMFEQEYMCSFIESELSAYKFDDIEAAFAHAPAPIIPDDEDTTPAHIDNPFATAI